MKWILIILIILIVIMAIGVYYLYQYLHTNIYSVIDNVNGVLAANCHDSAILNPGDYEWTSAFRQNYEKIRDEFMAYSDRHDIPLHKNINNVSGSIDSQNKWKSLFLRIINKNTAVAKYFPTTMALIDSCPCTLAYFSVFEPGTKLRPHVGIYKGVVRYHLALIVPEQWDQCFLKIDNQILNWHEGRDLMFDDMFLHHAENNTTQRRVVLFLDIKRQFKNPFLNLLNGFLLKFVKSNDVLNKNITNVNFFANKHSLE